METKPVVHFGVEAVLVAIVGLLLLGSLYLMGAATENSAQFDQIYSLLVLVNIVGLIILVVLLGVNFQRLRRQYRERVVGSRMTLRLIVIFVVLALIPVSIVFYFSLQFLHRSIDSWFDVRVEQALNDSLSLSRTALDSRMRNMVAQTETMAIALAGVSETQAALSLNDLRDQSDATELMLMRSSGRIIASSNIDPIIIVPNKPSSEILSQMRGSGRYVGLDTVGDLGLHIRVLMEVSSGDPIAGPRVFQALFAVSERVSKLTDSVQDAHAQYERLVYLRQPLKFSFTLTLSLVLLLTVLVAAWAAFLSARRLVYPIQVLATGTRAVASGNYEQRLPLPGNNDEMGFLVQSFNDMTRRIGLAQSDAKHSQQQAESQRAYLEAVLRRLSSGVLTLSHDQVLRTVNDAACDILETKLDAYVACTLSEIKADNPKLGIFIDSIVDQLDEAQAEWVEEVTRFSSHGRQVLMCRGATLPGVGEMAAGYVIVFDDFTTLIKAQRDAAWGEVARRLAHEIKNPLTPIQLSAERMRHRYLPKLAPEEAGLLDRSTNTIVQQVEVMKEMVKAFSDYARAPRLETIPLDLNRLIEEALDLYSSEDAEFNADLAENLPKIEADRSRIRQLLNNLLKNAIEAPHATDERKVTVMTRRIQGQVTDLVEMDIIDNGTGFPDDIIGELFEPYVTTKPKGTGLGLAIVKKIVEEHGGIVRAQNLRAGGAAVMIRFPALDAKPNKLSPDNDVSTILVDKEKTEPFEA